MHLGAFGQGQGKGADACKKINDLARRPNRQGDGTQQRLLALGCGLQEGTGWWRDQRLAKALHRGGAQRHRFAVPGQPRKAKAFSDPRQFQQQARIQLFAANHHDICPRKRARHRQRHLARARPAQLDQRFKPRKGGDQIRVQQLAIRHIDDHVRGPRVKAHQRAVLGAPCRDGGPPPRFWRRGQNRAKLGL